MKYRFGLALASLLVALPMQAADLNLAPLVYWQSSADGAWDLRVGGPLFQAVATADGADLMALRPLEIRLRTPQEDGELLVRREMLWPFSSWRLKDGALQAWFGPLVRTNADVKDPDSACRRWLLPILFAGTDENGIDYHAVFPLAGTVRDVAGLDDVSFTLFPLSLRTHKGDIHGQHWLFPIFAKVDGPTLHKRRVFPFWGYAQRDEEWRREFYLWPFFHRQQSLQNPDDGGWMLFPLFGYVHRGQPEDADYLRRRTFLWPFFSRAVSKDGYLLQAPWPFYQRITSPKDELERTSFFPLWSHQLRGGQDTTSVIWPFHTQQLDERSGETVTRTYFMPIYWSFHAEAKAGNRDYTRLWPLASWASDDATGNRDLRILDIWPTRNADPVERAYAPWWTLYRDTTLDGTRQKELLWGFWQKRDNADGSSRHTLSLLYDRHTDPQGNTTRAFLGGLIRTGKK